MLIGARLNWLLDHGRSPQWSSTAQFIKLISATEMDGNRAIAAPVVGISRLPSRRLSGAQTRPIKRASSWLDALAQQAAERGSHDHASRLIPSRWTFTVHSARSTCWPTSRMSIWSARGEHSDIRRNVIDMRVPRNARSGRGRDGHRHGLRDRRRGHQRPAGGGNRGDSAFGTAA